jgi:hypothetical protein
VTSPTEQCGVGLHYSATDESMPRVDPTVANPPECGAESTLVADPSRRSSSITDSGAAIIGPLRATAWLRDGVGGLMASAWSAVVRLLVGEPRSKAPQRLRGSRGGS